MKEIIKLIVVALVSLVILFLVGLVVANGLEKSDRIECQKLQRQSQEYPDFWLTKSEKDICDSLGVTIDAPVR